MDQEFDDLDKRIALLEVKHEHLAEKFGNVEDHIGSIVEKLDNHMEKTNDNITEMQVSIAAATVALTGLSKTIDNATEILKDVSTRATDAHALANRFDTIGRTTIKITSIVGAIVAFVWGVYSHFFK